MADTRFDVLGIGNAIVDVLAHADDAFIDRHDLPKGAMTLIDEQAAERLYDDMGPAIEVSGGSAANTIAGLASLGADCAFIGKVKKDQLGRVFGHDMRAMGVHYDTPDAFDGPSTARCMILVTPDAERTMQTYLGASVNLGPDDIDEDVVRAAKVTYLEGYLWDPDLAKQAFRKAARTAEAAGRTVALSLSDPFCVDRHRGDFLDLVKNHVSVLFANEDEIMSLYEVDEFDAALQAVRHDCQVAALTRGGQGSVVVNGDEVHVVDAENVDKVVDTTGAGDAYAAGFLWGLARNHDLAYCAHAGNVAAAEVIGHMGARPETPLGQLVKGRLG
jgi:sugar/nucleoside kinase (ribokinase family)